jgi:hypothetical protein
MVPLPVDPPVLVLLPEPPVPDVLPPVLDALPAPPVLVAPAVLPEPPLAVALPPLPDVLPPVPEALPPLPEDPPLPVVPVDVLEMSMKHKRV